MSERARVKICGVRRPEDAALAADLGARFIGCVLAADSPRRIAVEEVALIRDAVGGRADIVLVFRDQSADEIVAACEATGVARVQAHGAGRAALDDLCERGLRVHRVFAVETGARVLPAIDPDPVADCPAVLDVGRGGSGRTFDWSILAAGCPPATLIAGGITPDNVAQLLEHQPFGIDVSSGVESGPGEKDPSRVRRLFEVVGAFA